MVDRTRLLRVGTGLGSFVQVGDVMADRDIDDPIDYGSIVRNNLMKRPGYAPYCMGCASFSRMVWDGEQFKHYCGARTEFPEDFTTGYKARWHGVTP